MKKIILLLMALLMFSCQDDDVKVLETGSVKPMPEEWIDKDTGHKVSHVIPGDGENKSFYFHNNPFVPASGNVNEKMIFYRKVNEDNQLFAVDMTTKEIDQLTNKKRINGEIVGKNSRKVFYQCRDSVYSTGIDDHKTELIFVFPEGAWGSITTLNADETILAGSIVDKSDIKMPKEAPSPKEAPKKGELENPRSTKSREKSLERAFEAKTRRSLFILNIETGEFEKIYTENAWLNHVQFSPTDPELLMYCHEGPWHRLDRIWNININERIPKLMHKRTVENEIAGHEFFSPDGKTIWYDLQIPKSVTFYLASVNVEDGSRKKYQMTRDEWSIHFATSPDQKIFAGDGGDPTQVAKATDGMWLYLFRPDGDKFKSEKLVNMKHHNYELEPNVHFSPDGKSIIFRANFEGHSDIYEVEL